MDVKQGPFSIAYQILQECPFKCAICHRRSETGEKRLNQEERFKMVDILKEYNLKRLTITGGEPTVLGEELFEFAKYVHQQQIHVCLSTTGFKIDKAKLEEMNDYTDQILISIRSLTRLTWRVDYGITKYTDTLFDTVINLLQWIKTTGIILEISTVIHKENIKRVIDLGWQLVSLNSNIIWRIEDYYEMGIEAHQASRFKISIEESLEAQQLIVNMFRGLFRHISFSKQDSRINAPDLFITPDGTLVKTSNNRYGESVGNILKRELPVTFKTRRPWSDYQMTCRDWGWGDMN